MNNGLKRKDHINLTGSVLPNFDIATDGFYIRLVYTFYGKSNVFQVEGSHSVSVLCDFMSSLKRTLTYKCKCALTINASVITEIT